MKKIIVFVLSLFFLLQLTGCLKTITNAEISFDSNGGNYIETIVLEKNSFDIDDFPIPIKDGCEFKGWFLDENFLIPYDSFKVGKYTLYAKWEEKLEDGLDLLFNFNLKSSINSSIDYNNLLVSLRIKTNYTNVSSLDLMKLSLNLEINSSEILNLYMVNSNLYIDISKNITGEKFNTKLSFNLTSLMENISSFIENVKYLDDSVFDIPLDEANTEYLVIYLTRMILLDRTDEIDYETLFEIFGILDNKNDYENEFNKFINKLEKINLTNDFINELVNILMNIVPEAKFDDNKVTYVVTNSAIQNILDDLIKFGLENVDIIFNNVSKLRFDDIIYEYDDNDNLKFIHILSMLGYYDVENDLFVSYFLSDEKYVYVDYLDLYFRNDGLYGYLDDENNFFAFNDDLLGWYDDFGNEHHYSEDLSLLKHGYILEEYSLYFSKYEPILLPIDIDYATLFISNKLKSYIPNINLKLMIFNDDLASGFNFDMNIFDLYLDKENKMNLSLEVSYEKTLKVDFDFSFINSDYIDITEMISSKISDLNYKLYIMKANNYKFSEIYK